MAFPAWLVDIIARAAHDVTKAAAALMVCGVFLSSSALALIFFKAPPPAVPGNLVQLPGAAYYGILIGTAIFGLVEASFGFWTTARDPERWSGIAEFVLWISILPLCLVLALGSLAFVS